MSSVEAPKFERQLAILPEGHVKNYKDALKEESIALKGGSVPFKILHVLLGWDPNPAYRYNEAMRGVDRTRSMAKQYTEENLDLLRPIAIENMQRDGVPYDDGSHPDQKIYPENLPKR